MTEQPAISEEVRSSVAVAPEKRFTPLRPRLKKPKRKDRHKRTKVAFFRYC